MAITYTWSDIDAEFAKDTSGDVTKDIDIDAILNSLRNILGTDQGTRRMLQKFSGDIRGLLFEPMDKITARILGQRLMESIRYWEDRITVDGLDIEPLYDYGMYNCRLRFTIIGSDIEQQIDFVLSR